MALPQVQPMFNGLRVKSETSKRRKRRVKQPSFGLKNRSSFFDKPVSDDESGHTFPLAMDSSGSSPRTSLRSCLKSESSSMSTEKKSVSFDSVEINEHQVILGDNPSVSSGPPVTVAWESHESYTFSVDEYEESHPERRFKSNMLLPRRVREELLTKAGYSRSQLVIAQRIVNRIKKERAMSVSQQQSLVAKMLKRSK